MKKTFISLFLLSLLTVFGSLSVKADDIVKYFGYHENEWTQDSKVGQTSCAGNISPADKIITGSDFYFSGRHDDAFKRSDNEWTGVNGANNNHAGVKACTRESKTVSLSAGTYTFKLLSKNTENATLTLPKIILGSDEYTVTDIIVDESSQSFSSNQYYYTGGKETTLCYGITLSSAYNGTVSVEFKDGWKEKYLFKTLTISSNAPAAPTYEVSATASNGTVSGTGSFAEGEIVTLTASPNEDYSFSGWSSVSGVDLTGHLNENPLIFTMPGNAVSLTANFTACTKHTVTLTAGANGSVSDGGEFCDGSVTVTATPNSGYRFVNWTNTSTSAVVSTDAEYTFTLSADISLTANFEVNPCSSSLTIEVEGNYAASGDYSGVTYPSNIVFKEKNPSGSEYRQGCHGTGYVSFEASTNAEILIPVNIPVSGTYKVKAYAGRNKNMYINIYATTSTGQGSITYKSTTYYKQTYKNINGSHENDSFVESDYTDAVALPTGICLIGLYAEWSHSAWDQITITRTDGTAFCPNTITMAKSGDDGAAAPTAQVNSSNVTTAFEGTVVTVTADEPSDANHYFSGWTVSPENAVSFDDPTSPTTTFVMPAEDVTITANYGAVVSSALTFAAGEGGAGVSATAGGNPISSGDVVESGTSVTLTAEANSNYVFINWTDNNNNAVVSTNAAFTFSMPATATSYAANFAQIDNVISQGSETGSSTYNSGASMEESHMDDFGTFGHSVLKLSYSNMTGGNYYGWNIGKKGSYSSTNSAGATGFGFYYKTETDADKVAFCFDHGDQNNQYKVELPATNNVWKYHYFDQSAANGWNGSNIVIFINGTDGGNTTANANGAIYLADIAATSITSKPDINTYTYTRENASNSYGTLCLPMDGSVSGATLYSVAGTQEEGGKLYIVLEEQGATLAAGEPYIFETDGSTLTATMSGPHRAVKEEANGLVGTYQQITAPAYNAPDDLNYVLALDDSHNTVFKKVGANVTVDAYRAYINIKNAGDYSPASAAPGRKYIRFGIEGTEEEQAVEMIYDDASLRTRKIMQNGHLYILRDGHLFTVQGTQIK